MSYSLDVPTDSFEQEFHEVIEHFKAQNVLPQSSFVESLPFFNFPKLSNESQIRELFESCFDLNQYKVLLQKVMKDDHHLCDASSDSPSDYHVMSFAQIVLYKVLPCPYKECPKYPREIATHNQYTDPEYECPFYHHERDRRRLVVNPRHEDEFVYKANYFEEGRRFGDKTKYSQNYFESMFHPLYYKMFKCKRHYCNSSKMCPFFHYEDEKRAWDETFRNFVKKDRGSYVKDKQKYYEAVSSNSQAVEHHNRGLKENIDNRNYQNNAQFNKQRNFKRKRQGLQQPPQERREEDHSNMVYAFYNKSKEQEVW